MVERKVEKEDAQLHCHVQTIFKGSASEFLVEDTV